MTGRQTHPVNGSSPWRPNRRRLTDGLAAAIAPVAACSLALGGLTTWVTAGNAGSPARITVSNGRVFLPYGDNTRTAAFFVVTNMGGADDRLTRVTSSGTGGGDIELSRHVAAGRAAASRESVDAVTVRAGGELAMTPDGVDVTLRSAKGWRAGDLVSFTLHFEDSDPVRTLAVVVRPGGRF